MTEPVLEDLPYDDLRNRAFALAESRHDHGFFRDLRRHLPDFTAVAAEGGSLGDIAATLTELAQGTRAASDLENVGDLEPLFRARFATYLRDHG